jgi:glycosyltransferase involved in cell wall biosynthesis
VSEGLEETRVPRRTLAGATILQIVPALREEPIARSAVTVAHSLLQAGARALIAAEDGPLVAELRSFGGDWTALRDVSVNPLRMRQNARRIEQLIVAERVDIVHAHSIGGAWSARVASARIAVWLVTSLPDAPPPGASWREPFLGALAQGDRIIAPSIFAAKPMMKRFGIPLDQITIVPRAVDTDMFDPLAVGKERSAALRTAWQIPPRHRIVLAPGRVAPWNGQIALPEVARALVEQGLEGLIFVIVGEHRSHRRYARDILQQAEDYGVAHLFRITGHCPDLPAALFCADVVVVPAIEPPLLGSLVGQAQAMARPTVVSDVGMLGEYVLVPPRMPDELRTGWVVTPGDPIDLAQTLKIALTLDSTEYQAMAARARQFAKYMFSPQSAAAATRAVYTSLLSRHL